VASLRGPLGRMNEAEAEVAQLLSCGMSAPEIAQAIKSDQGHAHALMSSVTRKLKQKTPNRIPVCVW
jgi:DNA-binding NarL/FixJ family response regulator